MLFATRVLADGCRRTAGFWIRTANWSAYPPLSVGISIPRIPTVSRVADFCCTGLCAAAAAAPDGGEIKQVAGAAAAASLLSPGGSVMSPSAPAEDDDGEFKVQYSGDLHDHHDVSP